MENYILNNNSIAIIKNKKQTIIYDVDNYRVINKNINRVLEHNCNIYGSSLIGRKKAAKKILNISYKVPIIINDNIILVQLNNYRDEKCIFIVLNKIFDYQVIDKNIEIYCNNNIKFKSKLSKNSFEKLLINAVKLNNILKWQKNTNFV